MKTCACCQGHNWCVSRGKKRSTLEDFFFILLGIKHVALPDSLLERGLQCLRCGIGGVKTGVWQQLQYPVFPEGSGKVLRTQGRGGWHMKKQELLFFTTSLFEMTQIESYDREKLLKAGKTCSKPDTQLLSQDASIYERFPWDTLPDPLHCSKKARVGQEKLEETWNSNWRESGSTWLYHQQAVEACTRLNWLPVS